MHSSSHAEYAELRRNAHAWLVLTIRMGQRERSNPPSAYFAKSARDKKTVIRVRTNTARRIRRNAQTRTRLACAYHPDGSAGAKQSASAYFAKSARDKNNYQRKKNTARRIRRITQKRTRLACAYHPDGSAGAKQPAFCVFCEVCARQKIFSEKI